LRRLATSGRGALEAAEVSADLFDKVAELAVKGLEHRSSVARS
jgi:hypothetical protein